MPNRRVLLAAFASLGLLLALLDPQVKLPRATFDYVIALDITQSMNTTDTLLDGVPTSRLDYARRALHRVLPRLPCGSRVGWAVFTEYRVFLLFAPVEVCANYSDLSATLDSIDNRIAWAGGSEISKGLNTGLKLAGALEGKPRLAFITDGHEAPPLNPKYRPQFDGKPGEIAGTIIGVGGDRLSPIPKRDPEGNALGFWGADEVMQTDIYSRGRGTSVAGEGMVDESGTSDAPAAGSGTEHLSSLKEAHLRQLAQKSGLQYHRLANADALYEALTQAAFARMAPVDTDIRFAPAAVAVALLLWMALPAPRRRPSTPSQHIHTE